MIITLSTNEGMVLEEFKIVTTEADNITIDLELKNEVIDKLAMFFDIQEVE